MFGQRIVTVCCVRESVCIADEARVCVSVPRSVKEWKLSQVRPISMEQWQPGDQWIDHKEFHPANITSATLSKNNQQIVIPG